MAEKSGETKKERDFWGNEKEVHFDSHGNKTGETRFTESFFSGTKQEHYDTSGHKTGETRKETSFLGGDKAVHYDTNGKKVGSSHNGTNLWGEDVQRHYDTSGKKVGETHHVNNWLGNSTKSHTGEYFKSSERDTRPQSSTDTSNYNETPNNSAAYQHYDYSTTASASRSGTSPWKNWILCLVVIGIIVTVIIFYNNLPSSVPETLEIIYQDDFNDADSGWYEGSAVNIEYAYENGKYSLFSHKSDWNYRSTYEPNVDVSDSVMEVEVNKISGGRGQTCGIIFREKMINGKDNLYYYEICHDQKAYRVSKLISGDWTILVNWTYSDHILVGTHSNKLKVSAIGSAIEIFVNGYHLAAFQDHSLTEGKVGMAISTPSRTNGSHYHFDNFKIYRKY
jgi:hypothetical protein